MLYYFDSFRLPLIYLEYIILQKNGSSILTREDPVPVRSCVIRRLIYFSSEGGDREQNEI